ncbi:MAG: acyltransferase [Deltaproteobacteria bacterium]|nr:acyltransferase [Deltaproteobacteria bacterium]
MLQRSFGAKSFAEFWRHWNPIFGYYLGKYSYVPASRFAPRWLALTLTFVLCGGLHDVVTLLFRGYTHFLFTRWFFLLAIGVLIGETARMNMSQRPPWLRGVVHLTYLSTCLLLAASVRQML